MSSSRRSVIYILVFMISYLLIKITDRRLTIPECCLITLESLSSPLTVSPPPELSSPHIMSSRTFKPEL